MHVIEFTLIYFNPRLGNQRRTDNLQTMLYTIVLQKQAGSGELSLSGLIPQSNSLGGSTTMLRRICTGENPLYCMNGEDKHAECSK